MSESVELYIIASSANRYAALRPELAPLPPMHIMKDYADAASESGGFDAFFESLMSAREWGLIPMDAPLYRTCVIKMPDHQTALGRPLYGLPGIPIAMEDEWVPQEITQLVLQESFRAIRVFNEGSPIKLRKIGAVDLSLSLSLDELEPGQALKIFEDVLAKNSEIDSSHVGLPAIDLELNHNLYR